MVTSGTRLGPYEIVAPIGFGGMGQVFRAHDPRLDRMVAIKVVAAEAAGAQAFERFAREARAVAAINHPNICAIYDLGAEPVPYVVMELLEGETLQQRLTRGPLEIPALVEIALPLAEALAAVHAKGIIHRDLKPANIFLTPHGPKILDFGLARMTGSGADASDAALRATLAADGPLTDAGVTVGTVAYMSPEQLRAEGIDARSDLFSLGAVLFEMIAGRPAFARNTTAVTSAAILHDATAPPSRVRPEVPPPLDHIVLNLLEKDRETRTQSASELRAELVRFRRSLESGRVGAITRMPDASDAPAPSAVVAPPSSGVTATAPQSSDTQVLVDIARRHRPAALALVIAVAGVLAGVAYLMNRPAVAPAAQGEGPAIADLEVLDLTTSNNAGSPAISPDGKYVAYVEHGAPADSLRVRQVVTESNVEVVPAERGLTIRGATFSPDGAFVYYVKQALPRRSELWRVPFLGGPSRLVIGNIASLVNWSPDAQRMAFLRADVMQSQVIVANADGTAEQVVATRRIPEMFWHLMNPLGQFAPVWSPDGTRLALLGRSATSPRLHGDVVLLDVTTRRLRAFNVDSPLSGESLTWLDDERLVISTVERSSSPLQLWLMSARDGRMRHLTNDLSQYTSVSVSADRTQLVSGRITVTAGIWAGDASGTRFEPLVPEAVHKGSVAFGLAWVGDDVLYVGTSNGRYGLVRWRSSARRSELLAPSGVTPLVSRDQRTIVFQNIDTLEAFQLDAGGGTPIPKGRRAFRAVSPDGREVFSVNIIGANPNVIAIERLDGSAQRELATGMPLRRPQIALSPDGQFVAFAAYDDRQQEVTVVCDIAACASKRVLPAIGPIIHWTPDGSAIAFTDPTASSNVMVQPLDGRPARPLTRFPDNEWKLWDFAWSADGRRLAVARGATANNIVLLKGLNRLAQ